MDLSKYQAFVDYKMHPTALKYIMSESPVRCIFKGNQGGATEATGLDVALRVLGIHPIARRNHFQKPIRMVSKIVPEDESDERNQQYVTIRRYLGSFITKKITARNKILGLRANGRDVQIEFMASTQELDAFMSVQRGAYYQDEEIERLKWDESLKRLLKEGGDANVSITPVRGLDWMYDNLWCRTDKIYRSKLICEKFGYPAVEDNGTKNGIECFCWATDDNPVLTKDNIEQIFRGFDDPDELAMARYGIFRQVSGRIYKIFDASIHVKPYNDIFNTDLFKTFWHYRIIDYHPQKPWCVSWVAISDRNEWFVWNEYEARHEHKTTLELRDEIKSMSLLDEDEQFNRMTLIDPLAVTPQANTTFSVLDDLRMGDYGLRRMEPADTKNSVSAGRMNIKMRLKNALICGVPYNNFNRNEHQEARYGIYLPTLWFLDNCTKHVEHFKQWRYVDYKQEFVKAVKVVKREGQKYSDYPRNLEFLGCIDPVWYSMDNVSDNYWENNRFQGQRQQAYGR